MIEDAIYQDLSIQLGKIASATKKISKNQLNFSNLYEEVMKMDGFATFSPFVSWVCGSRSNF
ncbi:hypothetical protein CFP56_012267 [Quercus suber]|uniref:Uncharacterized protein n=1 Tax=Quercus suber TaxID=58331 RepID=A0AAW0M4M3_QUESU